MTSGEYETIAISATAPLRLIIANDSVTRLIVKLSGTADLASKLMSSIRTSEASRADVARGRNRPTRYTVTIQCAKLDAYAIA